MFELPCNNIYLLRIVQASTNEIELSAETNLLSWHML